MTPAETADDVEAVETPEGIMLEALGHLVERVDRLQESIDRQADNLALLVTTHPRVPQAAREEVWDNLPDETRAWISVVTKSERERRAMQVAARADG